MNYIIYRVLIILILTTSFISNANSEDIVITIPEKFSTNQLPLPPFPKEVVQSLEEVDYETDILGNLITRDILQNGITYTYYPEFINSSLSSNGLWFHTFLLETDFNSLLTSYSPEYTTNDYSISGNISYTTENHVIGLEGSYREFRLPINISLTSNFLEPSIQASFGYTDYSRYWNISPTVSIGAFSLSAIYHDKSTAVDLNLETPDQYWGFFGYGCDYFKVGLSTITGCFYPYLEYKREFGSYLLKFITETEPDILDYKTIVKHSSGPSAGVGVDVSSGYSQINPYILFTENFFFGEREYHFGFNDINFNCSFIKEQFTSIISLDIVDLELSAIELLISYKVGKI